MLLKKGIKTTSQMMSRYSHICFLYSYYYPHKILKVSASSSIFTFLLKFIYFLFLFYFTVFFVVQSSNFILCVCVNICLYFAFSNLPLGYIHHYTAYINITLKVYILVKPLQNRKTWENLKNKNIIFPDFRVQDDYSGRV